MNKRLKQFESAISSVPAEARHWRDVANDPNDPLAVAFRAQTLRSAWRDSVPDRADFIVERSRGRRVLDIGCVAHDIERMKSSTWLHRRVADAAESCVGVDILSDGVAHMRTLGFDAVDHDLSSGPGPLAALRRFDVIVAGELIEHVADLDMLFKSAKELLAPGGELILTTPNPYAPHRVLAGQRGDCWENTDHILYAFPGGIAELADRNGLMLAEAFTTTPRRRERHGLKQVIRSAKRRVKGSGWILAGVTTQGRAESVPIRKPSRRPDHRVGRPRRFVGESFVYSIRRRPESPDA